MDENEKHILRWEREFISKEVAQSGRFQDVVYELKERLVLAPDDAILLLNSESSRTSKMLNLLRHLETCKSDTFQIFIEILMQLGLFDVVKRLDQPTYEHHRGSLSGESDKPDVRRVPNFFSESESSPGNGITDGLPTLPRPTDGLPTLPRHNSVPGAMSESYRNGNNHFDVSRGLNINVIPARVPGGSEHHPTMLYKNLSMPRGLVFMANYKTFLNDVQPVREGSEKDVRNLLVLFQQMGYKVPEVHWNLDKYSTIKALRDFKNLKELSNVDSCVIVIMSHGRDEKSFYTSDNQYLKVNDVVERFSNRECEFLSGKPKIFIFQYCRGTSSDTGVLTSPREIKNTDSLQVFTDSASQGEVIVDRDPTYTDMYIVYSTLEGFVSFRHPDRGSWLMEAICQVFMDNAHNKELETLMKMVSQQVRQNLTDEGNKQVCEYVQRAFDRHFYFNPQPLSNTNSWNMQALSDGLSQSVDSLQGAASPLVRTPKSERHQRPLSWSRGTTPEPSETSNYARHRNFSGASASPDYNSDNNDSSNTVVFHPRARPISGNRRYTGSFLQPSHLSGYHDHYNRSISENVLGVRETTPDPSDSPRDDVFMRASQDNVTQSGPSSYDTVDHPQGGDAAVESIEAGGQLANADVNMGQEVDPETQTEVRHSIKRQLSFPSTNETLMKINDVKKFLQVHDSDPKLLQPLQRIESFVNKKKYEGKRRKKDNEASSLDY